MIYSPLLLKKPWCLKWPAVKWLKYCQYGMKQINQSKWLYNVSKWLTKSLFLGYILYLHWESLWQGSLPFLHTLTGGFSPLSTFPDRRVLSPFYVPWQGSLPFLHTLTGSVEADNSDVMQETRFFICRSMLISGAITSIKSYRKQTKCQKIQGRGRQG